MEKGIQGGGGAKKKGKPTCADDPPEGHGRYDHDEQTAHMFLEVGLREVGADVEEAYGEHDARELERDGVLYRGRRAPRAWVEYVETVRPNEDPEGCTENDFADVQLRRR